MEQKISIIVPVYNVERYIGKCIESIINQTYKNIEIILIDDGSTDGSGRICNEYAKFDDRIIVKHKENLGVSAARNQGIDLSSGEMLIFVDSDDYLKNNAVENMVKSLENNQMVICGYIEKYVDLEIKHIITSENTTIKKEKAMEMLFDRKFYGGYLWNKIFVKKILQENKIKFDEKIHMCEDMLFVLQYMSKCKDIKLISDILYYYRMRKSSVVWNIESYKYKSLFKSYAKILEILEKNNVSLISFKYELLISIFKSEKMLDIKKEEENLKMNFSETYYKLLFNKKLELKRKIKLIIIKRFKFMYNYYMRNKINKLKQYE